MDVLDDQRGHREVELWRTITGVAPVDDNGTGRAEEHVVRVQVEVNNAVAGIRPRRPRVQLAMQVRQQLGAGADGDLAGGQRGQQGRTTDALEDEIWACGVVHAGHGITVPGSVTHDARLAPSLLARSVAGLPRPS